VATLNKRLVDRYVDDPALAVVAAPVELEPFQYFMFWHPRLDHDPAQQWLRETIGPLRQQPSAALRAGANPPD
jgi:DNA-binding transcriptional LysR family regulator